VKRKGPPLGGGEIDEGIYIFSIWREKVKKREGGLSYERGEKKNPLHFVGRKRGPATRGAPYYNPSTMRGGVR